MKLPFRKEEFLGNIRSGKRRENNSPCNIDHFNVHHDSYTSEYSIELFESIYKDKTDTLLIIPVTNMIINYEIYKKEIKCRGEAGKKAITIDSKGQKTEKDCDPNKCEYAKKGKCSKTGRIYFRLVGIENKGVWCYTTKSTRMEHIKNYLNFMGEKGIDITQNQFLLTLKEKQGTSGKVYAPDIKLAQNNNNSNTNQGKVKSLYKYIEGKMIEYKSQKLPRVVFVDKDGKENIFFMTHNSKKDILNLGYGTEIEIKNVLANKSNDRFLMDYNVIKRIEKIKKAV